MSDVTPPAGGFGAPRTGQPTELMHHAADPPRTSHALHVIAVAFACFIALILGSAYMFASGRERAGRSAEARVTIGDIAKKLQATYARQQTLCPSTRPVPADFESVRGKRYSSTDADWNDPGWACIGFERLAPQRYQYRVETTGELVTITATGDLDGDDLRSRYAIHGHVDPEQKALVFSGAIEASNDGE